MLASDIKEVETKAKEEVKKRPLTGEVGKKNPPRDIDKQTPPEKTVDSKGTTTASKKVYIYNIYIYMYIISLRLVHHLQNLFCGFFNLNKSFIKLICLVIGIYN